VVFLFLVPGFGLAIIVLHMRGSVCVGLELLFDAVQVVLGFIKSVKVILYA